MDLSTTLGVARGTGSSGLSVAASAAAGKTDSGVSTAAAEAKNSQSDSGDSVTISSQGRSLADALAKTSNADTSISGSFSDRSGARGMTGSASAGKAQTAAEVSAQATQSGKEDIAKRIEKLQQEIREAQQDPNLTDKERQEKVARLQTELMALQTQQQQAAGGGGNGGGGAAGATTYHGGTRAQGMSSSLT